MAKRTRVAKKASQKRTSQKTIVDHVWKGTVWTVKHGELKRSKGRPPKSSRLFQCVGEKLPFDALEGVREHFVSGGTKPNGVYVAHDSMGTPRYIGRGDNIFGRLKADKKDHEKELVYFSFYIVEEKQHEREIETLLIRAAGPQLEFNERKKRIGIKSGDIKDYEPGTFFYERQAIRGRKTKRNVQ